MVALVQAHLKDPGLAIAKTALVGFHLCTPGPWFVLFLGPSKMRTNQKTHQLKQYKIRGHVGPFGVAIK